MNIRLLEMMRCADEKFIKNVENQIFFKKISKKNLNIFLFEITQKNIKKAGKNFKQ